MIPEVYADVYNNNVIVIVAAAVLLAYSIMNLFWSILILKVINWSLEFLTSAKILPEPKMN
jgi:hypothetical protein